MHSARLGLGALRGLRLKTQRVDDLAAFYCPFNGRSLLGMSFGMRPICSPDSCRRGPGIENVVSDAAGFWSKGQGSGLELWRGSGCLCLYSGAWVWVIDFGPARFADVECAVSALPARRLMPQAWLRFRQHVPSEFLLIARRIAGPVLDPTATQGCGALFERDSVSAFTGDGRHLDPKSKNNGTKPPNMAQRPFFYILLGSRQYASQDASELYALPHETVPGRG